MTTDISSPPTQQDGQADLQEASDLKAVSPSRRRRRLVSWLVVLIAFAGAGFLLYRTLDSASLFFLSVDRAVAQREDLGSRRFQLHGTPVPETIQPLTLGTGQTSVRFSLAGNDSVVDVLHVGAPPDLFQPCVPVVLRGRWQDSPADSNSVQNFHFSSTQILVKHDNDYTITESSVIEGSAGGDSITAENHQEAVLAKLDGCPNV